MSVPDPRHVCPGILLVGRAALWLHLSLGSARRCFSLQIICGVPRRYRLWCLFCRKTVGMHGIFINMIRCSGEKTKCLVSSGTAVHTIYAVFCQCPAKQETVSQPVKASSIGSACAFSGPKARPISGPARMRKDFPVLVPILQFPPSGCVPGPLPGQQHQYQLCG